MNAAIRRDLQHGVAALVNDVNTAGAVLQGEVRAGKGGIGGVTAFKACLPIVGAIHSGIGPAAGDRVQEAERIHEVGESLRCVARNIHGPQPEKVVARPKRASARTG